VKFHRKLVALGATAILLSAAAGWAQESSTPATPAKPADAAAPAKAPALHSLMGKVVSCTDTQLVLSHHVKGKATETTFALDAKTQKRGELKPGEMVTVSFKTENDQNLATRVRVAAAKKVAARTPSTPGK
jgi:ABC-type glycerol-3-phosphate transport system substrate-binding protein